MSWRSTIGVRPRGLRSVVKRFTLTNTRDLKVDTSCSICFPRSGFSLPIARGPGCARYGHRPRLFLRPIGARSRAMFVRHGIGTQTQSSPMVDTTHKSGYRRKAIQRRNRPTSWCRPRVHPGDHAWGGVAFACYRTSEARWTDHPLGGAPRPMTQEKQRRGRSSRDAICRRPMGGGRRLSVAARPRSRPPNPACTIVHASWIAGATWNAISG